MKTADSKGRPPASTTSVQALFRGAARLTAPNLAQLVDALEKLLIQRGLNQRHEMHPSARVREPLVAAIRKVAAEVGHPPSSTEYIACYRRRRETSEPLPSITKQLRHFGRWQAALAGAGLGPRAPRASGTHRRRNYQQKVVHRYPDQRLVDCLRACHRDLGRIPLTRDYVVWREEKLPGRARDRRAPVDIPHYTTYRRRWGSWDAALEAAGLDGRESTRTQPEKYSLL